MNTSKKIVNSKKTEKKKESEKVAERKNSDEKVVKKIKRKGKIKDRRKKKELLLEIEIDEESYSDYRYGYDYEREDFVPAYILRIKSGPDKTYYVKDVIKFADWIVDLGPEGGNQGGKIVAQGSVTDIVENSQSYTGQWLKKKFRE